MTTETEMTKPPVVADADVAMVETARRRQTMDHDHPRYRWVVLSNTTLGTLLATINASIVLISLPAIFRGIGLNPLAPGNVSYLLWMLMGYLVVTAVLVVPRSLAETERVWPGVQGQRLSTGERTRRPRISAARLLAHRSTHLATLASREQRSHSPGRP